MGERLTVPSGRCLIPFFRELGPRAVLTGLLRPYQRAGYSIERVRPSVGDAWVA
jgi:hypothetical protein